MKKLMQTKKTMAAIALAVCSIIIIGTSTAKATYNANATGKITRVWTYQTAIAFMLSPMPATNCTYNDFFYIMPNSFSETMNNTAVSILLAAVLSGKTVNVGYDKDGGACYASRPYIHRVDIIQ